MLIGIDLGGTKILTAVADEGGRIISSVKMDTQARSGPKRVIENIISSIDIVLERSKTPMSKVTKIGIGAPGPIVANGIIVDPPNLPGWGKINIKKTLQGALRKKIVVENDANAAAMAEYRFGSGKGSENFVYLTVSTGIGGGIILDGKLYRGSMGTAGELGHMVIDINGPKCGCGNHGCLEAMASGPAIARMAGKNDALEVINAAKKGNKTCLKAIKMAGKYIGIGTANIINVLNPDIVAVGGGISNMGKLIFDPIRLWARQYSMKASKDFTIITAAKLKNDVGVMGAIAICLEGLPAEARRAKAGDD